MHAYEHESKPKLTCSGLDGVRKRERKRWDNGKEMKMSMRRGEKRFKGKRIRESIVRLLLFSFPFSSSSFLFVCSARKLRKHINFNCICI